MTHYRGGGHRDYDSGLSSTSTNRPQSSQREVRQYGSVTSSWNSPHPGHKHKAAGSGSNPKVFPQDSAFFCEACFVGCKSQLAYDDHLKAHIKCDSEGCSFEGIEKALLKHKKNAHQFAVAPSRANAKWQQERKRKFPNSQRNQEKEEQTELANQQGATLQSTNKHGKFKIESKTHEPVQPNQLPAASIKSRNDVSLLEKLMLDDVRHEHNVLLQCIRHLLNTH